MLYVTNYGGNLIFASDEYFTSRYKVRKFIFKYEDGS
jgi:hypothetical protein